MGMCHYTLDDVGDCLLSFWGVLGDHAIVKEMLFMVEGSQKKSLASNAFMPLLGIMMLDMHPKSHVG